MKKNTLSQSGIVLSATGLSIMLLGVAADSLHFGSHGFGLRQLSVVVVGGIVMLSGLRKLFFPSQTELDGVFLATYFLGLLFIGTEPRSFEISAKNHFLTVGAVSLNKDFVLNLLGFLPFGYLMVSYLLDNSRLRKMSAVAVTLVAGTGISLSLEMIQYFIPGRASSLSDWLLNSLGTFLGVCFYLLTAR